MPDIFGLDLAGIINDAIVEAGDLVPGVLTSIVTGTRTPGDLSSGTNPTSSSHTFSGFLDATGSRSPGSRVIVGGAFISIMGASVSPAVVPKAGDQATIEGKTYDLLELVERDPAAVMYQFRVEV